MTRIRQFAPITRIEDLTLPMGDYVGQTLGEVADKDLLYLQTLIERVWFARKYRNLSEAIRQILRKRAGQVEKLLE